MEPSIDWQALSELATTMPATDKAILRREVRRIIERRRARNRLQQFYPDSGPLRRELYPKHLQFFALGLSHGQRGFIAANRTGKTTCAGFEGSCHLTGKYPDWWMGRRFSRPVVMWASGEDSKSVRESVQPILFGPMEALGTGMIPGDDIIGKPAMARGGVEMIDSASIQHISGGASRIVLKSYEQGREAFQAAKVDVGWCDEEPPMSIYNEFLTRLMSTTPGEPNGAMMCTFTPLKGMSEVVMSFLGEDWRRPDMQAIA